jgi:DNA-binding LacI/PurR family transcriptional regulator
MTVSRVINDSGCVSVRVRERAEQAIKELNYHPTLTTVDQPTKEQGHEAARLLLERIEDDKTRERREICLACHPVIRQSTINKTN